MTNNGQKLFFLIYCSSKLELNSNIKSFIINKNYSLQTLSLVKEQQQSLTIQPIFFYRMLNVNRDWSSSLFAYTCCESKNKNAQFASLSPSLLLSLKTLIEARKLSDIVFSFCGSDGSSKTPEDDLNHLPELISIIALTAGEG